LKLIAEYLRSAKAGSFDTSASNAVAELFYSTSRPERFQLFNHLSAAEIFFVEFDSLLLECASNLNVRLDLVQPLHIVYLAESLLRKFLSRGGKFHVVYFERNQAVYSQVPQLAAARCILAERLRKSADAHGFHFKHFASWSHSGKHSYAEYHARHQPEFVLVNDGEQLAGINASELKMTSGDNTEILGKRSNRFRQVLRMFAATVIGLRTHVVFTSRLLFKDNDILGFVIRAQSRRFVPLAKCLDVLRSACASLLGTADEGLDIEDTIAAISAHAEKHELVLTTREYVMLPALATVLEENPDMRGLVQAQLVALVAASQLPIASRCLPRIESESVQSFMDAAARAALPFLTNLGDLVAVDEKFCDLFDGNLLAHVVSRLQEFGAEGLESILDEPTMYHVSCTWQWVYRQAGLKKQPLESIDVASVELTKVAAAAQSTATASGLSHPLVKEMTKRFKVEGVHFEPASDDSPLGRTSLEPHQDFSALDTPAGVREEEAAAKEFDQLTYRQQKAESKKANNFISSIQKTADSMDVKPFLNTNESLAVVQDPSAVKDKEDSKKGWKQGGKKDKGKKSLSATDRIKKDNKIKKATEGCANTVKQFGNICTSLQRTTKSLNSDLKMLDDFVKMSALSKVDSADRDSDSDEGHGDRDTDMWAEIVGEGIEADFILGTSKSADVKRGLAAIDEYVKQQEQALKKKQKTLLEEDDDDAALRLKSLFFDKFLAHLRGKALVEALRLARKVWMSELSDAKSDSRDVQTKSLIPMFQRMHSLIDHVERTGIVMVTSDRQEIRECAMLTGFGNAYEDLINDAEKKHAGRNFQPDRAMEAVVRPSLGAQHTVQRFQMNCMGHLLQRPISKTDDQRVPFNPDPWQVDLLDIVDNNGSAVVCAPTSAGKTFISYYCMKKVLRESNDNVVVYVCPTRALINQALADVYGRYGQKKYSFSGQHVFGCLGGVEYVKRPFKCQVLVTLPETFEAILLAPRFQAWSKKIRYVIFDEIHSIESTGNGDVWERLLMLVRCPFVALSATLGATAPILSWLNGVQQKIAVQNPDPRRDYTVHMVPKAGAKINRWSDIQKYAFMPSAVAPFTSIKKVGGFGNEDLLSVHPMSAVTLDMLREKFPEDLPFVPSESLHVFDKLVDVFASHIKPIESNAASWLKSHLKKLKPEKYFNGRFMTQAEARRYESEIKECLLALGRLSTGVYDGVTDEEEDADVAKQVRKACTAALTELLAGYENVVKSAEQQASVSASNNGTIAHPDTFKYVQQNMVNLLTVLRAKELLPTICFSFEESDCQELVEHVVTQLEDAEAAFRQTKEFKDYEEMMKRKAADQAAVLERMSKGVGKVKSKDEDGNVTVRTDEIKTVDEVKDYSIPDVLPQFSFRADFDCLSAAEMNDVEYELKKDDLLFRAYKRGIGMHTPDIKGKRRVHIERLFRMKLIPVVFATEGLALGVHSPCRSVVLGGDHVHLNTSQFRQMIGRAGRRGLDFLGHAIFLGVSQAKMQRLLTSDLATLKGHVHIDPIVELRLQQMYDYEAERDEQAVDRTFAAHMTECLLSRPLFYQGLNSCPDYAALQVRHFGATLGLLARVGFVHKSEPSSLGCLVSRVMNTFKEAKAGAGAIMFGMLTARGFFHSLADVWAAGGDARIQVYEHVLKSLSYFFTVDRDNNVPLEVHRSILSDPTVFSPSFPDLAPSCPHDVVLPGLKNLARRNLLEHITKISQHVVASYSALLAAYAEAEALQPEVALPFATKNRSPGAKAVGESKLVASLHSEKIDVKVRSPFAALCSHGDTFACVEDLVGSLRAGLFLDAAHVPCIDFRDSGSRRGDQILINAAIPDFIDEGSQFVNGAPRRQHLETFNGLRQDKSWYTLNRFMTIMNNTLRGFSNEDGVPCLLKEVKEGNTDQVYEVLQEIVLQLETRASEISFKFPSPKVFSEAQVVQTQKKAKRPALGKEVRRRR
jgi:superfamily II RNA helicase